MGWSIYFLHSVFAIDVVAAINNTESTQGDTTLYLVVAIVATLVAATYSTLQIRKAVWLAGNGVEITGTITSIGRVSAKGIVRVDCMYTYAGAPFRKAWTEPKDIASQRSEWDEIALIVDPDNPSRCMRRDEVLVGSDLSQPLE